MLEKLILALILTFSLTLFVGLTERDATPTSVKLDVPEAPSQTVSQLPLAKYVNKD